MRTSTRADYEAALRRAIHALLQGLDEAPDPEAWAAAAGFSRCHFGRVFSALVGEAPFEFRRRILLERAAARIAGGQPVTEAAFEAGYSSLEAFDRAVGSAYGRPPSQIRGCAGLPTPCGLHWPPILDRLKLIQSTLPMDFRTEETEAKTIVGLAHHGPYHMIGQTFERLGKARTSAYTPGEIFYACYLDDPSTTPPDQLRSFAGFIGDPAAEPGLESMEMPAGRWAIAVHVGPYSGLGHAWMQAYQSLPEKGFEPAAAPCWEVYIDDCDVTAPDVMRTELWLPIR